jgi:hypothetical protein
LAAAQSKNLFTKIAQCEATQSSDAQTKAKAENTLQRATELIKNKLGSNGTVTGQFDNIVKYLKNQPEPNAQQESLLAKKMESLAGDIAGAKAQITAMETKVDKDCEDGDCIEKAKKIFKTNGKPVQLDPTDPECIIYRGGGDSPLAYTPRPNQDDQFVGLQIGLSTFGERPTSGSYQTLQVSKIPAPLAAFYDKASTNHVSVRPGPALANSLVQTQVKDWAKNREKLAKLQPFPPTWYITGVIVNGEDLVHDWSKKLRSAKIN